MNEQYKEIGPYWSEVYFSLDIIGSYCKYVDTIFIPKKSYLCTTGMRTPVVLREITIILYSIIILLLVVFPLVITRIDSLQSIVPRTNPPCEHQR